MRFLIILSALFVSAYCQQYPIITTDTNCGKGTAYPDSDFLAKITGGKTSKKGDFGWTVLIHYNNQFICSGAIINKDWIVTSAWCLFGRDASALGVDISVQDRFIPDTYSETRRVARFVVNEGYQPGSFKDDIAMLKLSNSANLDYTFFLTIPVCVASGSEKYEGRTAYITGYGSAYAGGPVARFLTQTKLPILTNARCEQKFPGQVYSASQICAGDDFGFADFCEYDSGAPLVVKGQNDGRWHLVGLASFGRYPCGNGGVYTRVSAYTNWIQKNLQSF